MEPPLPSVYVNIDVTIATVLLHIFLFRCNFSGLITQGFRVIRIIIIIMVITIIIIMIIIIIILL